MRRWAITALAALFTLTGCSTDAADPAPAPTPTTSTATPATATPTAVPVPPATATDPAVAGCDTILTDDEYAALESDGLTLTPDIDVLDDTMQSLMDEGFGCYWTRGGGDVRVWYAQAEQSDDAWAAQRQELIDDGWTQTDSPREGVLQAPAEHDPNYLPAVVHLGGMTYYASYSDYFSSVKALLG